MFSYSDKNFFQTLQSGSTRSEATPVNTPPASLNVASSNFPSTSDASFNADIQTFKAKTEYGIVVLQRMFQELKNQYRIHFDNFEKLQKTVDPMTKTVQRLEAKFKPLMKMVASQTDTTTNLSNKVTEVENKVERIVNDMKTEFDNLKQQISLIQQQNAASAASSSSGAAAGSLSNDKLTKMFEALERQLGIYDVRIAEMDLRFQVIETTNYNGCLIWRIQDYHRRKEDAKRGRTLSLYSQPFYTSKYGYKMCARIYLNGDGMGKGTHVSIFFVVMKGEYDALLPWPFRQKVTMMCLDQGVERRHLVDTFRPDPNSTSFKRPTSDMNIASGCPLFAAHDVIEGSSYIQEDVLFIRIIVDTSDLENF